MDSSSSAFEIYSGSDTTELAGEGRRPGAGEPPPDGGGVGRESTVATTRGERRPPLAEVPAVPAQRPGRRPPGHPARPPHGGRPRPGPGDVERLGQRGERESA